ncbi:hypothetical protein [Rhizobium leguminosarum]|uniref:hypothetical protein n=1 Tax=Rhizobium leguminosarum TaxID=384 RepID=UPI000489D1F0|nr:hypothetical protein [Rhizobium leguminosarum]
MMVDLVADQRWLHDLAADRAAAAHYFEATWTMPGDRSWGITGSTFRAYRGHRRNPSHIYREWAAEEAAELSGRALDVSQLHETLRISLAAKWSSHGTKLGSAHRDKTIDLFIMHVARCGDLSIDTRQALIRDAHVPLDRHSLRALGLLLPALAIGRPSMGSIASETTYTAIQSIIRQVTSRLGIPNLYFDIWSWPADRRRTAGLRPSNIPPEPLKEKRAVMDFEEAAADAVS